MAEPALLTRAVIQRLSQFDLYRSEADRRPVL
jgi:hypothetical protein